MKSKAKLYLCLIASILFVKMAFSQGKVYTQRVDSSYFHFRNSADFKSQPKEIKSISPVNPYLANLNYSLLVRFLDLYPTPINLGGFFEQFIV